MMALDPLAGIVHWADQHIPGSAAVDKVTGLGPKFWSFGAGDTGWAPKAKAAAEEAAKTPAQATQEAAAAQAAANAAQGPWHTLADPLATQLYFAHVISPMLNQLTSQFKDTNSALMGQAQNYLATAHLPQQFRDIFSVMLPQQAAAQRNTEAAMAGASVAGPALDTLLNQLNATRQATTQDYMEQLKVQALGGTGGGGIDLSALTPQEQQAFAAAVGSGGPVPTNPYTTPTTTP